MNFDDSAEPLMRSKTIQEAAAKLKHYMNTYDEQGGYNNYLTSTFVNDVLYGLGIAIDPDEYGNALGYKRFREDLVKWLTTQWSG